ncbi:uncharacterized protein [Branchiostoma lanceolatum]|uniref:uncharacterized protein n=1 Tax=Branchiostoma lanceolatum TaxID=7740 RepID=UPI00345489A2
MGRFCGSTVPGPLITSGNTALLHFRSDTSVTGKGFELKWNLDGTTTISSVATVSGGSGVTTASTTLRDTGTTRRSDNVTAATKGSDPAVKTSGRPVTTTRHTGTTKWSGIVTAATDGGGASRVSSVGPLQATWYTSTTKRPGIVTASWDNFTLNTEDYTENIICYVCEGKSPACSRGEGLEVFAMECREDEACWVERITERRTRTVYYRRSCQPKCPDYWQEEVCMTADGQAEVCSLCCTEDRCNTHVLTGHSDARGQSDTAGTTVASLRLVSILALTVCLDILAIAA